MVWKLYCELVCKDVVQCVALVMVEVNEANWQTLMEVCWSESGKDW